MTDLGKSGVRYRCGRCGAESEYQREAKLPPGWSLEFVHIELRMMPKFICVDCAQLPGWTKAGEGEAAKLERLRREAEASKPTPKRGRKKK